MLTTKTAVSLPK